MKTLLWITEYITKSFVIHYEGFELSLCIIVVCDVNLFRIWYSRCQEIQNPENKRPRAVEFCGKILMARISDFFLMFEVTLYSLPIYEKSGLLCYGGLSNSSHRDDEALYRSLFKSRVITFSLQRYLNQFRQRKRRNLYIVFLSSTNSKLSRAGKTKKHNKFQVKWSFLTTLQRDIVDNFRRRSLVAPYFALFVWLLLFRVAGMTLVGQDIELRWEIK